MSEEKDYSYRTGAPAGTPNGQITQHGRPVYTTANGESVSERSASFYDNQGNIVNMPTIWDGREYNEDQLRTMLDLGLVKANSAGWPSMDVAAAKAQRRSDGMVLTDRPEYQVPTTFMGVPEAPFYGSMTTAAGNMKNAFATLYPNAPTEGRWDPTVITPPELKARFSTDGDIDYNKANQFFYDNPAMITEDNTRAVNRNLYTQFPTIYDRFQQYR